MGAIRAIFGRNGRRELTGDPPPPTFLAMSRPRKPQNSRSASNNDSPGWPEDAAQPSQDAAPPLAFASEDRDPYDAASAGPFGKPDARPTMEETLILNGVDEFDPGPAARPLLSIKSRPLGDDEKAAILEAAQLSGRPYEAALQLGVRAWSLDKAKEDDQDFAAALTSAVRLLVERREAQVDQRAFDGTLEKVFFEGAYIGDQVRYSDKLAELRLAAMDPARYGRNVKVDATIRAAGVLVVPGATVSDAWSKAVQASETESG